VKELELSKDAKDRLAKLEELSNRAASGDKVARRELRRVLRESGPEVVREASEVARIGQWALIKIAAVGEPLAEEALVARLDLTRVEVAGENPSALESLLTEKIVAVWILTELLELLLSAQLAGGDEVNRVPHSFLRFYLGWLEQAHRRLLTTIKTLAQVRRLQSGTPSSQTNVQINVEGR
jgi:hypothetical protein